VFLKASNVLFWDFLIIFIVILRLLDESVRWLLANNKWSEAERLVRKAARQNNVNYDELVQASSKKGALMADSECIDQNVRSYDLKNDYDGSNASPHSNIAVKRYSFITIFKHKRILLNSMIVWLSW